MKICAMVVVLAALAASANAAVVHDESVDGDLSSSAAAPTPLAFALGGNTVIGTTTSGDRDFLTFTIAPNQVLSGLNLLVYTPNNLGFAAFNAGTTSYVPSGTTNAFFLAGIHVEGADQGTDILPRFVDRSVTTYALDEPQLGPGDYSFIIQQLSPIIQSYSLEFVVEGIVSTESSTWGAIKALYK
jgi:hypothetical protein